MIKISIQNMKLENKFRHHSDVGASVGLIGVFKCFFILAHSSRKNIFFIIQSVRMHCRSDYQTFRSKTAFWANHFETLFLFYNLF